MKKKAVKIALICAAGIIVLAAIGTFVLQKAVENIAEQQIQAAANKLIGRDVYIQNISYNIFQHQMMITNLCVPNPEGYSTHPAITVKSIQVDINPMAAFKRLIHIKKLHVDGILFSLELQGTPYSFADFLIILTQKKINILDLKRKSIAYQKQVIPQPAVNKPQPTNNKKKIKQPVFIRIDKMDITNTSAIFQNYSILPKNWRTINLPDYHLNDIGKDNNLTTDKLAAEIFKLTYKQIKEKTIGKAKHLCIEKLKKYIEDTEGFIKKTEAAMAKIEKSYGTSMPKWIRKQFDNLKKRVEKAKEKLNESKKKLEELQQKKDDQEQEDEE